MPTLVGGGETAKQFGRRVRQIRHARKKASAAGWWRCCGGRGRAGLACPRRLSRRNVRSRSALDALRAGRSTWEQPVGMRALSRPRRFLVVMSIGLSNDLEAYGAANFALLGSRFLPKVTPLETLRGSIAGR